MDKSFNEPKLRQKVNLNEIIVENISNDHPILKSCFKNSIKIDNSDELLIKENLENNFKTLKINESIKRTNLINFENIEKKKKISFKMHEMKNELFNKDNNNQENINIHENNIKKNYIKNNFKIPRIKNEENISIDNTSENKIENEIENEVYSSSKNCLWRNLYITSPSISSLKTVRFNIDNDNDNEEKQSNSFLNIRLKNIKEKQNEFKKRQEEEKLKNEEMLKEYLNFKKNKFI